jgi:aryl-alcohol dehydrogenase-like predicted oxidoreductase
MPIGANRLALGTVQFGLPYGVANDSGQVNPAAVATILGRARTAGVDTLDTAANYGGSEACLGAVGVANWHVITKLPGLPSDVGDVGQWVEAQLMGSLRRLGVARLHGLLLHRPADLHGPHGRKLVEALEFHRTLGRTRSLGVSIYDPAELDALCNVWNPDIVQAPCNVLDRRLIHSGWLERLNRTGVRVHIRSIFLQGLLLMSASRRPAWFKPWSDLLDRWESWCAENEMTPLVAAMAFGRSLPGVERIVVGVDSMPQLEEILTASAAEAVAVPEDLSSTDRDLIEPSRWKLQ